MIKRWIFLLSLGVAGAYILRTYLVETISVATGSMEPTLYVDTHYLINRTAYWFHEPRRGDIISFASPIDRDLNLVKRVIAVSGDRVELRDKVVYIDDQKVDEPFTIHKRASQHLIGDTLGPLTVPDGRVFVLGDNRDVSEDSSVWVDPDTHQRIYFVPEKSIRGRLILFQ